MPITATNYSHVNVSVSSQALKARFADDQDAISMYWWMACLPFAPASLHYHSLPACLELEMYSVKISKWPHQEGTEVKSFYWLRNRISILFFLNIT